MAADSKGRLEDIYLPYKPKRRTKAEIAKEAGLEPLADLLLKEPQNVPAASAEPFVSADKNVADVAAALDGARAILVERFAENADLIGALREELLDQRTAEVGGDRGQEGSRRQVQRLFRIRRSAEQDAVASRAGAAARRARRGARPEDRAGRRHDADAASAPTSCGSRAPTASRIRAGRATSGSPRPCAGPGAPRSWSRRRLDVGCGCGPRPRRKRCACSPPTCAICCSAAPAGARATLGLDPDSAPACKVAVVDATGKVVDTTAIFPHEPQRRWDEALAVLANLVRKHKVELVAIGNGTASRETEKLANELVKGLADLKLHKVVVSEAGASVYSASAFAAEELPGLDVTLRGAVSIARRLQDPLAELVKIDPKSIGVGQYQHDLSELKLSRSLGAVVEDCVNRVGVDLNTASAPLLARVSGIGAGLAQSIVTHPRHARAFQSARRSKDVPRLGPGVRAVRGLPAHHRWRRSARRLGGASGSLSGGAADHRGDQERHQGAGSATRPCCAACRAQDLRRRDVRPADRHRHSARAREAWTRSAAGLQDRGVQEGVETLNDLKPGMVLEGAGHQRGGIRRLRRYRRAPGWIGAHLGHVEDPS